MSMSLKAARAGSQGGIRRGAVVNGGGIFSAIGGVVKRVGGAAISLATGGGVAGAAGALLGRSAPRIATLPAIGPALVGGGGSNVPAPIPQTPVGVPRRGVGAAIARVLPGGDTGLGTGCPSGYHPNKSGYYTRDGYVEKGTRCVRNRKRNPLNPRALDRSMGRLRSAGKAVRALGFKAPTVKDTAQGKGRRKKR